MKKFLVLLAMLASGITAQACEFPCKPVTFVMSVGAGGPADSLFVRPFSEFFLKETGQPLVIEYMPAAEGILQIRRLKAAPGDGYTIGLIRSSTSVYKPIMDNVDYNPVTDLTNIGMFVTYSSALYVHSNSPYMTYKDLVVKGPKKGINIGASYHGVRILTRVMSEHENIDAQTIMYPGDAPANTALLGQHVDGVVGTLGGLPLKLVKEGTFRVLATTGKTRNPAAPTAPTFKELGLNIEQYTFLGVGGPPNMDPAVLKRLNTLLNKFMFDPEMVAKVAQEGMQTPTPNTPEATTNFIDSQIKVWDGYRRKHNIPKNQ